jgi:hypothetical protein
MKILCFEIKYVGFKEKPEWKILAEERDSIVPAVKALRKSFERIETVKDVESGTKISCAISTMGLKEAVDIVREYRYRKLGVAN